MNWKIKAAVQRACDYLPVGKDAVYRQLQLRCGGLRKGYDYQFLLSETARMAQTLRGIGYGIEGAVVMEVGTGWRLDVPIGLYLCGARKIITCDLNRYLVNELALDTVRYIGENAEKIFNTFAFVDPARLENRLAELRRVSTIEDLFHTAGIEYYAPCDCAETCLNAHSIDIHYSYTVFEHIPGGTLEAILREANRLLSNGGVALHHIDLSDHFAQVDPSITPANFLRYSDSDWSRYSGTPWSYHNRLREDEYRALFERVPQEILYWQPTIDPRSLESLQNGFPLAPQYRGKPLELLSTSIVDVVSRPAR
jgi:SAM-dependent methyltransferase